MSYKKLKYYFKLFNKEKVSRKTKKLYIGYKLGKSQLKKLLKSVVVEKTFKTMYETPIIKPYLFCPKCGCEEYIGSGNWAEYPEHWETFYCLRCNNEVAEIDNSPFVHVLEYINEKD